MIRPRDMALWVIGGCLLLGAVLWLGRGSQFDAQSPLSANNLHAMTNLFCFLAAFDAIIIVGARIILGPASGPAVNAVERRHHHVGRISFMASIAFAFSLAGTIAWLLPLNRDERMTVETSPLLGGAFLLMMLLSGTSILLAQKRQHLFDRRHQEQE